MRPPTTLYRGERLYGPGGTAVGVRVTVDGRELSPRPSWKLRDHSPTGFEWGYPGSGPAQLALAVVFDVLGDKDRALDTYQFFKLAAVACWSTDRWQVTAAEVLAVVEQAERERAGAGARTAPDPDAVREGGVC